MSYSDVYYKVYQLLNIHFSIAKVDNLHEASFSENLGMNIWEKNHLLYMIEQSFNISIDAEEEKDIKCVNHLVDAIHRGLLLQNAS